MVEVFEIVSTNSFGLATRKGNRLGPRGRTQIFDSFLFLAKQLDLTHRADRPTQYRVIPTCLLPVNQPGQFRDKLIGFDILDKLGESDSKSGDRHSINRLSHLTGYQPDKAQLIPRAKAEAKVDFRPEYRSCRKQKLIKRNKVHTQILSSS